jgi:hypothetical protein
MRDSRVGYRYHWVITTDIDRRHRGKRCGLDEDIEIEHVVYVPGIECIRDGK